MTTTVAPMPLRADFDAQRHYEAAPAAHAGTFLSIIVPTRNEAGNIAPLVAQLSAATAAIPTELVFVDDSDDETEAAIEAARATTPLDIVLLHRPQGQRDGGLGGAVLAGLRSARGTHVCVMDGDLQHPPALVPQMLARLQSSGADLVVASRYWEEGAAAGLNRPRTLVSRMSSDAARLLFPGQLRSVTDPMSGFFMVRKSVLNLDELRPNGFKILLEILVRHSHLL